MEMTPEKIVSSQILSSLDSPCGEAICQPYFEKNESHSLCLSLDDGRGKEREELLETAKYIYIRIRQKRMKDGLYEEGQKS